MDRGWGGGAGGWKRYIRGDDKWADNLIKYVMIAFHSVMDNVMRYLLIVSSQHLSG